jgi:hypothetical protein
LPAVHDVADQIDRVGVMITKEVEEAVGLTAASAEMDVGDEESTVACRAVLKVHEESSFSV